MGNDKNSNYIYNDTWNKNRKNNYYNPNNPQNNGVDIKILSNASDNTKKNLIIVALIKSFHTS